MNDATAGNALETSPPTVLAMLSKGHMPTGFPKPSYNI
jgi:hypothetical protein